MGRRAALLGLFAWYLGCGPGQEATVDAVGAVDASPEEEVAASALVDPARWMAARSDSASLADLTIPGSHESAALYEPFPGTAKCQTLGLRQQLDVGVRYLDIRVRQVSNAFTLHHGSVYQHANFDDVLGQCVAFLQANPTEAIIMEVSPTHTSADSTETNEETFMRYANNPAYGGFWWRGTAVPTLGEVRGKIVLVRRFAGNAWRSSGIDVTGWQDNAQFTLRDSRNTPIVVQDHYVVKYSTNDNKWRAVTTLLGQAATSSTKTWYINFTSGYRSFLGIPDITGVSKDIDARLATYFASPPKPGAKYGTIVSDFVTPALVAAELAAP